MTDARSLLFPLVRRKCLIDAKAENVRLGDAIRDMLDVATGWSRPMETQARLTLIVGLGNEALRG